MDTLGQSLFGRVPTVPRIKIPGYNMDRAYGPRVETLPYNMNRAYGTSSCISTLENCISNP